MTDTQDDALTRRIFHHKNAILGSKFSSVQPRDYAAAVFKELDRPFKILHPPKPMVMPSFDSVLDMAQRHVSVFLPYCSFFVPRYSRKYLADIYAFCLDIDDADSAITHQLLSHISSPGVPRPSYIVNSGNGLHCVYALQSSFPCQKRNRKALDALHAKLRLALEGGIPAGHMDSTWIGQPFRLVGGLTKFRETTQAFQVEQTPYTVQGLAERFGIKLNPTDDTYVPPVRPEKKASKGYAAEQRETSNFYEHCRKRCLDETPANSRYKAMMALVAVGKKSRISPEVVHGHLRELVDYWNTNHLDRYGHKLQRGEIPKAMRVYQNWQAYRFTSRKLEEWFGWEFERKPRAVKSQAQHLKDLASQRTMTTKEQIQQAVDIFQEEGRRVTATALAEFLGMSSDTVNSYAKIRMGKLCLWRK